MLKVMNIKFSFNNKKINKYKAITIYEYKQV